MHADDENENDHRKDPEFKLEKFFDHSQFYLNRLPLLKTQLNDLNRLNQEDLYIEKLSMSSDTTTYVISLYLNSDKNHVREKYSWKIQNKV